MPNAGHTITDVTPAGYGPDEADTTPPAAHKYIRRRDWKDADQVPPDELVKKHGWSWTGTDDKGNQWKNGRFIGEEGTYKEAVKPTQESARRSRRGIAAAAPFMIRMLIESRQLSEASDNPKDGDRNDRGQVFKNHRWHHDPTTQSGHQDTTPLELPKHKQEYAEVAARYNNSNQWMKAPNGEPSKLNEAQWVQARTPSFKNWFGDWEISAQKLHQASTFDEARTRAKTFQGKPLTSADGVQVIMSRNNLDKMLSESAVHKSESPAEHALAVANLDRLFAKAVTGWTKIDRNNDPNLPTVRRMFAPMQVKNKVRLVKLTVKEYAQPGQKKHIYSVEALEVGKVNPVPEMVDADMAKGHRLLTGPTGLINILVDSIQKFNTHGASQIVNDHGEPLVAYHGSRRNFDQFSSRFNHDDLRSAHFFAEDIMDADLHSLHQSTEKTGAQTYPVYLGLKNPLVVNNRDDLGDTEKEKELFDRAKKDGHDGVIFDSSEKDLNGKKLGRVFVAFHPSQIKSALGNQGTFNPDSPKTMEAVIPTDPHAAKIKLVQAIIARHGIKPPQPKAAAECTGQPHHPCWQPKVGYFVKFVSSFWFSCPQRPRQLQRCFFYQPRRVYSKHLGQIANLGQNFLVLGQRYFLIFLRPAFE